MYRLISQLKAASAGLSRKKGYVATVMLTMGLTLGGLLCALSLNYLLLFQPLPYPNQASLFVARQALTDEQGREQGQSLSYPGLLHLYKKQESFQAAAMVDFAKDVITSLPSQPLVFATYVTPEYGSMFDVKMARGRFLGADEGLDAHVPSVVISYEAWTTYFDRREDILEQSLKLSADAQFRIVGVTAKDFVEPSLKETGRRTHVWVPWDFDIAPKYWGWTSPTDTLVLTGLLKPDTSAEQARQSLTQILSPTWQDQVAGTAASYRGWTTRVELTSVRDVILGNSRLVALTLLAGMAGLVLIACINIINLILCRIGEQQRALSIHAALGAKKRHIFQLLFREIGLLVGAAVVFGLVVVQAGFHALKTLLGDVLPRAQELSISLVTVGAAILLALSLAWLFAFIGSRVIDFRRLNLIISSGGKNSGVQVSSRVRNLLIASQVTVASFIIFVSCALFANAYGTLSQDRGYDLSRVHNVYLNYSALDGAAAGALQAAAIEMRDGLRALPNVETVSQSHSPLQDFIASVMVSSTSQVRYPIELKRIDHYYLDMLGTKVVAGRGFTAEEIKDANPVMLVNRTFARQLGGEDAALGQKLTRDKSAPYTVVGVVDDIVFPNQEKARPRVFLPAAEAGLSFVIKYRKGQVLSREEMVSFVQRTNSRLGVFLYDSLEVQQRQMLFAQFVLAVTTLALVAIVVLLATVGLYGIISYATQLRRIEIGTRMAIGAKPRHIIAMAIRDYATPVLLGIGASLVIVAVLLVSGAGGASAYLSSGLMLVGLQSLVVVLAFSLLAVYLSVRGFIRRPAIYSLRAEID
ncbi:MAG: ABC transporter permease [Rhodanobacteraceae bacterium]